MIRAARWIEVVASPGREHDVVAFLIDALPVAQRDGSIKCWFGLRLDHSRFAIFDVFDSEPSRGAGVSGAIGEALKDRTGSLFSVSPKIGWVDVLASKLPSGT